MSDYYHAKARLALALTNLADHLERHHIGRTTKSINEVVREYTNLLERLVVDAANGNARRRPFVDEMQTAIIDNARLVYLEGMTEGGITDPEAELEKEDENTIRDWILSQTSHVGQFVDDAIAVNKLSGDARTAARDTMLGRVALWVQSLEALGRQGYASAKANQMGTWRLGRTEEHCARCSALNGQRHRLSWFTSRGYIPQEPGSETLDCGGWNCLCGIFADDGARLL